MRVILVFLWWGICIKLAKVNVYLTDFKPLRRWAWRNTVDWLQWSNWCSAYIVTHDPKIAADPEAIARGVTLRNRGAKFNTEIESLIKEGKL